jgi:hypothetical protein
MYDPTLYVFNMDKRYNFYIHNVIVVSLTSFWIWSIGLKYVKGLKNHIQTYKLVTLDGIVSRFIYVTSVTDQNDAY